MRRGAVFALPALLALLLAGCGGCGGDGGSGGGGQGPNEHPNDPFYGVISGEPPPGSEELAGLGDAGVGTLQINLAWGSVQAAPDAAYDWSHYDPVVRSAAENGVRVLATVYSTPGFAASTAEIPPLGSSLRGFETFARAAVERYGADGSFWDQNPDVPKLPVTDWQLWNEPNSPLFWKPSPDPRQYLRLLRAFDSAVKGSDPERGSCSAVSSPPPATGSPWTSSSPPSTKPADEGCSMRSPSIRMREDHGTPSPGSCRRAR